VPAPSVAADADGNFVVAWRDYVYQGYGLRNGYQIQARRFAADGTPSGAPFQVGSIATGYAEESGPSIAADEDGNFVVVWRDYIDYQGPDEQYGTQIQARGFAASGTPAGPQFGVGKETSGYVYELDPSVAVDVDGDFVVVWRQGYQSKLQERTFAADGTPTRRQCRVDIDTGASYQTAIAPSVASDADGDFVVVWRSYEYDYGYGYYSSIQARFGTRAAATECRDQLFFAEDLVAADNACAQAVADDSSDGEARFFRAATRIMRIVGEDVDGPDPTRFTDSVKEMMDQFGISSTGRDVFAFAPEIPINLADDVVLPPDSPGGSDVKELQSDVLLPAINASVEDLRAIAADTVILLSACELGVLGNFTGVEIDLGDVELFKAMLLLGKSEIFLAEAFDANVDIDSYTPLPEIIRIQTDWIDDNPQALELLPTGASSLAQANDANREAIASYLAGSAFIRSESDAQDDDFFTIEPDQIADEADLRIHIASLRSSLDGQTQVLNEGTTFIDEAAVIAELNQTLGTAFDSQGANLDLSLFYDDAPFSLREVIPPVAFDEAENRNFIADGSFPDPTFRGVLLPVPEPSQLWQLMSGLAGLGCLYRLRRRA
jgi:hypothetical protein